MFSDVCARAGALLDGISIEGKWIADIQARTGALSALLRERGAKRIWAFDSEPALYKGGEQRAHRFLCGDPTWLHRHPHVRAEAPPEGFEGVICASGIERLLAPGAAPDKLLESMAALCAPEGFLLFDVPASWPEAGEAPESDLLGSVSRVRQRVGDGLWEFRSLAGVEPVLEVFGCNPVSTWHNVLKRLTFPSIVSAPLEDQRLRVLARRV